MFGKRRFGHDICCHVNEWHEVLPSLLLCFIYDFFGGGEDTAPTTLRHREWANSLSLVAVGTPHLLPSDIGNGANSLSLVAVGTPHLLPSDIGNGANSLSLVAVGTPHLLPSDIGNGANSLSLVAVGTPHLLPSDIGNGANSLSLVAVGTPHLLPSDIGNGANSLSLVAVGTPHLLHKGKLSRCSVSLHPHPANKKCTRLGHGTVAVSFGMPSGLVRDLVGTQHLLSLPLSIRFVFAFFDAVRTPHLLHKGKFTLPKDFTAQPSGGMDTVIPLSSFPLRPLLVPTTTSPRSYFEQVSFLLRAGLVPTTSRSRNGL